MLGFLRAGAAGSATGLDAERPEEVIPVTELGAEFAKKLPKIFHTLNKSATLRSRPGRRIFSRFCRDLDEVSAAQGVLRPAANPGLRIFSRFCRDLDWIEVSPEPVDLVF